MAQNFTRSSSGTRRLVGQGQHPGVEVEPGELAVQVPLVDVRDDRHRRGGHGADRSGGSAPGRAAGSGDARTQLARRPRGGRGPSRAGCPRARRRGRCARGCAGTAGRRGAAAPAGPAPGPGTPPRRSGRRSRCRPPSAATPGRGTRCGRAPAAGRPRGWGWSWTSLKTYLPRGANPGAGTQLTRRARQLFWTLRDPTVTSMVVSVPPLFTVSVSLSPGFLAWMAERSRRSESRPCRRP